MKNRIIGVTGLTGVGKDYLVGAANADRKIETRNLGTMIGSALNLDRDEMMEAATPDRIRAAQLSAYRSVVDLQPVLVTCHAVREMANGDLGYDREMEQIFNPLTYVFVHAPAELILERTIVRNKRGERKSPVLGVDVIEEEQSRKLELVRELTDDTGSRLVLIDNIDSAYVGNVAIIRSEIELVLSAAPREEI